MPRLFAPALLVLVALLASPGFAADDNDKVIGALGALQPKSGQVQVSGLGGNVLATLRVGTGDAVKKGDVLADYRAPALGAEDVRVIEAELAQIDGNNAEDLSVQKLAIDKARGDLGRAQENLDSYVKLARQAQVKSVLSERKNAVADARNALDTARAEYKRIEIRAKLARTVAEARLERAMAAAAGGALISPMSGIVMAVLKQPGESADGPVFTIADLSTMQVECEVYEGDLARVSVGQKVTVSSKALGQEIQGTVVRVGRQVNPDNRVGKVWADLDTSDVAARYIGMEVNVKILP